MNNHRPFDWQLRANSYQKVFDMKSYMFDKSGDWAYHDFILCEEFQEFGGNGKVFACDPKLLFSFDFREGKDNQPIIMTPW